MKIVKLSENLGVSAQITVEDVAAIAAAGYDVIINNRPDAEEPNQPAGAAIEQAAQAAGLDYYHLPITAQDFPGAGFAQMASLLDDQAVRVLAFCRSGTRCTNLWVASQPEAERGEALETARQNGFDLAMVNRYLGQS